MTAFLIVSGIAVLWAGSLLVHPFGLCPVCSGRGVIIRKKKRKAGKCWLCKGHGRRQRIGSRTVHRVRRQVAAHWRGPR